MTKASNDDYGPVAKTLHWLTVLLVIVAWTLGMFGEDLSERSAEGLGLWTHIWIGLTILVVAVVRMPSRTANPPPKIGPTEFGRWLVEWTDPASGLMHYVLYGLLVIVPAFGIALQFAQGHSLPLFGLGEIPSPWLADKAFAHRLKELHEFLADLLVALAVFHMTAALVHHIVFGDNTLRRMLPQVDLKQLIARNGSGRRARNRRTSRRLNSVGEAKMGAQGDLAALSWSIGGERSVMARCSTGLDQLRRRPVRENVLLFSRANCSTVSMRRRIRVVVPHQHLVLAMP